jgi:hypothetical protein
VSRAGFAAFFIWVMVRYGMVAPSASLVAFAAGGMIETLDPSKWFFGQSLVALLLLIGLAAFGFGRSLGSHTLFSVPVLED